MDAYWPALSKYVRIISQNKSKVQKTKILVQNRIKNHAKYWSFIDLNLIKLKQNNNKSSILVAISTKNKYYTVCLFSQS